MGSHVDCIACLVTRANSLADTYIGEKKQKYRYLQEVLKEILDTGYERTAPLIEAKYTRIARRLTGIADFYEKEKRLFNDLILSLEPDIAQTVAAAADPLLEAMKAALGGNIIDFAALKNVSPELVRETIFKTLQVQNIDQGLYSRLLRELADARSLFYLGDNAGEIVLDKIFIKELGKRFPQLKITFVTRAIPISSDVTEADAYYVGMDKFAAITNNGTDLPGTDLLEVSPNFLAEFNNVDVIIAKGQGNFETLSGSGKNIYYLFLCKCDVFIAKLNAGRLTPIFRAEF
jgi:damage-control phosphatase, subfamily I